MIFFKSLSVLALFVMLLLPAVSYATSPSENALSKELISFLPDHVCPEDVVSFIPVNSTETSTIYRLETVDGGIAYQVISTVAMEFLPTAIEWACIAAIKNPSVCKYVKYAGQALIAVYGGDIAERAKSFWSTNVRGDKGFAHVYSNDYLGATDAQKAFQASKEQTDFPWSAPITERYRSMDYGRSRGK